MFDWIPDLYRGFYGDLYIGILLIFVLGLYFRTWNTSLNSKANIRYLRIAGMALLIISLLFVGFRPMRGEFDDMYLYRNNFLDFQESQSLNVRRKDWMFTSFSFWASKLLTVHQYFFVCFLIYIGCLWIAARKWLGNNYYYYLFLMFLVSFQFWNYGVNGIRNGMATSFIILAFSREKWVWKLLFFYIAYNFHGSSLLPIVAYFFAYFYSKPWVYLSFWLLCIPLSLGLPGEVQNLLGMVVDDQRTQYLTGEVQESRFSKVGFRWDFLFYSSFGVFAGWYYIFKKNYKDKTYDILYCTYLLANATWVLVIRANYSNRFAYLSWFMMAVVIGYPLAKHYFFSNQNKVIAQVSLAYFGFTFLMQFVYYGKFFSIFN